MNNYTQEEIEKAKEYILSELQITGSYKTWDDKVRDAFIAGMRSKTKYYKPDELPRRNGDNKYREVYAVEKGGDPWMVYFDFSDNKWKAEAEVGMDFIVDFDFRWFYPPSVEEAFAE